MYKNFLTLVKILNPKTKNLKELKRIAHNEYVTPENTIRALPIKLNDKWGPLVETTQSCFIRIS